MLSGLKCKRHQVCQPRPVTQPGKRAEVRGISAGVGVCCPASGGPDRRPAKAGTTCRPATASMQSARGVKFSLAAKRKNGGILPHEPRKSSRHSHGAGALAAGLHPRAPGCARGSRCDRTAQRRHCARAHKRQAPALVFTSHEFAEGAETILDELARRPELRAAFFLTGAFVGDPSHEAPPAAHGARGALPGAALGSPPVVLLDPAAHEPGHARGVPARSHRQCAAAHPLLGAAGGRALLPATLRALQRNHRAGRNSVTRSSTSPRAPAPTPTTRRKAVPTSSPRMPPRPA